VPDSESRTVGTRCGDAIGPSANKSANFRERVLRAGDLSSYSWCLSTAGRNTFVGGTERQDSDRTLGDFL